MTRPKKILKTLENHPRVTLATISVIFAALVLGNMTRWSIWFDEAFSAYLIRFNFVEIVQYTAADVHPPLYYWLLKIWTIVFGASEIGVRSISLVFAVVGIVGVYYLIRRLFTSEKWALIAAAAAAFSPMLVRYSHEARMYTLIFAVVVWATYLLVMMLERSGKNKYWVSYGVLLAIGMYTHYFVALAWLAHWVWRWYEVRKKRIARFWDRDWIRAHLLAIGLFAAWLPTAVHQFAVVQTGFWIPPLSAYTPIDYLSNTLLYREYGEVIGWWAIAFYAAAAVTIYLAWYTSRRVAKKHARSFALLASLAYVPPLLLMILSIPPLSSAFMDRYVLYSQVTFAIIVVIGLALLYGKRARLAGWLTALLVLISGLGIYNVYYYGNYNKNSGTSVRVGDVVRRIEAEGEFGQPIVAASPWIYYEAAFYDSRDHRVYYIDADVDYIYGSLDMLKLSDMGKIKDLDEFSQRHRYVWYLGSSSEGDIEPPKSDWKRIKSVEGYDYIDDGVKYRASLFDTQPDAT